MSAAAGRRDDRPEWARALVDVPEAWPVEDSRYLHRDDWVMALRQDRLNRPGADGEGAFPRLVLEHPGAAVVLAVDDEDRVLCLWQYRHAAGHRFVELPAGLLDTDDESPEEVARRELAEEARLRAEAWTHLGTTWSSPGVSAERIHTYVARGLSPVGRGDFTPAHEEADMDVAWVPFEELLAAVLEGRVTDAPLVVALLLAHARGMVGTSASADGPGR